MKNVRMVGRTKNSSTSNSNSNLGNTLSTGTNNRIKTSIKKNVISDSNVGGGQPVLNNFSSLGSRRYGEILKEKKNYPFDSKRKENITTLKVQSKTEYDTGNTNKIINVNQYNSLITKEESNNNNTTFKLYKIYNPVKIEYTQIKKSITTYNKDTKNISIDQHKNTAMIQTKITKTNTKNNKYRDRRGDNDVLKQKIQTKIETKIDKSKYKITPVIHKNPNHYRTTKVLKKPEEADINDFNLFRNIKNKYLLKQISNYLQKEKILNIIKYNKKIQNRLEININDYIKCSKIEIEIILWEGKKYLPFDFINVNKEDESYFHFYFDDNEKEIKKHTLNDEDKVNKIKVIIDHEVKSFKKLFYLCYKNKKITFKKFYRNNIKDMSYMFGECQGLIELDLSNFNTNNATDMSGMFYNCPYIKVLNLTNFNTKKVNNMSRMFQGCKSLKQLDLSSFDTNNVTDMYLMFAFCMGLENLNLSNFNTKNVVDMREMFIYCSWLNEINISNFIINEVTKWSDMFKGCSGLLAEKIRDKIKIIK